MSGDKHWTEAGRASAYPDEQSTSQPSAKAVEAATACRVYLNDEELASIIDRAIQSALTKEREKTRRALDSLRSYDPKLAQHIQEQQ